MNDGILKILVVGGYGTFGGRLIDLLAFEPRFELLVAGRSQELAEAFCKARPQAQARLMPVVFDRDREIAAQLAHLRPQLVVDASGPFQAYGADPFRLVQSCVDLRIGYLDLADGAAFVEGVAAFDSAARLAGIYVLSGASSFPVLTAAAVRALAKDLKYVDAIRGGIAPSPYAGVGRNVIRAIAGYAGQPAQLKRNGRIDTGYPFTETMRFVIAPPGRVPLESRLFSLVDVPDLRALALLWPEARDIWMGAAPVPESLHRVLIFLAWLVRLSVLPSLLPFASLMNVATNRVRWGEHRGGMFVAVEGKDGTGRKVARSWHLLAEGDDGPLIPSMAIEALVRRMLDGQFPSPGARPATTALELADYQRLFVGRTIYTGMRETGPGLPLYESLMGSAWQSLPPEIRAMHGVTSVLQVEGCADVIRGSGLLARLAGSLFGFPPGCRDVAVQVRFDAAAGQETWTRTFAGRSFSSRQFAGSGRSERLLCERFGPIVVAMALVVDDRRLRLVLRRWSLFGLPLPMVLGPRADAYESAADGRFYFHVELGHPLTGLIVRYSGWLAPPEHVPPL
jgi:hypothetical protein